MNLWSDHSPAEAFRSNNHFKINMVKRFFVFRPPLADLVPKIPILCGLLTIFGKPASAIMTFRSPSWIEYTGCRFSTVSCWNRSNNNYIVGSSSLFKRIGSQNQDFRPPSWISKYTGSPFLLSWSSVSTSNVNIDHRSISQIVSYSWGLFGQPRTSWTPSIVTPTSS